jgi:hypothetical protein
VASGDRRRRGGGHVRRSSHPERTRRSARRVLFTLGFNGSNQTFVILARQQRAIRELRADLSKPRRERRIVSGIVRTRKPYNEPWSYTMGPQSIVLGEAFIEVCDASPTYVQHHRADWLGKRWCPWSSYVTHAGR